MATGKRHYSSTFGSSSSGGSSENSSSKKPRQQVQVSTFEKWKRDMDKNHSTLTLLCCVADGKNRSLVSTMYCKVCTEYEDKILGLKNFSAVWLNGSYNHRTNSITDHAQSDQHTASMHYMHKAVGRAQNKSLVSYSPLARFLMTLNSQEKASLMKKFDICYFLAREGIAFKKYPSFHALEQKHGVELGSSYMWPDSAKIFTHFIAESQRQAFFNFLSKSITSKFFSFLMDGSTDSSNSEVELVLVAFCVKNDETYEMQAKSRYLALVKPARGDAEGLLKCLGEALHRMNISNIFSAESVLDVDQFPVLVGAGTDGASVNVGAHGGMKAKLQSTSPWLFWSWCFAHRLELACKDAFISPLFQEITEMLLRLYYLYHNSPKKSQELTSIIDNLKDVFDLPSGGALPVRCNGSRWITHKRKALQRVVDKFGAYLAHLTSLSQDSSLKPTDKARIKGYLKQWSSAKMLLGSALYIDILQIPSTLSLSLQQDSVDIVSGINGILKSMNKLAALSKLKPLQWPTVKVIISKVNEEGTQKAYQGCVLNYYTESMQQQCFGDARNDLQRLERKISERLEWSDMKLLRCILVFLDTRSWTTTTADELGNDSEFGHSGDNMEHIMAAADYIISLFRRPLEAKGATISSFNDELEEIVSFGRNYLNIEQEHYKKIWYKLHTTCESTKWPSVLLLSNLLFSLPFTTAAVESAFSTLKVIKTDRRCSLHTSTLDDLLEINLEGPAITTFSSASAVELWWQNCMRRPNQSSRNSVKVGSSTEEDHPSVESDSITSLNQFP